MAYIMNEPYNNNESIPFVRQNGRPLLMSKIDMQYGITKVEREMIIAANKRILDNPNSSPRHVGIATKNILAMSKLDLLTVTDTTAPQQIQVEIIRTPPVNQ